MPKISYEPRWASINIKNISPNIITNCFLMLEDILDEKGKSVLKVKRLRRLLWSTGDVIDDRNKELEIVPNEERVGDVAVTLGNRIEFRLETNAGQETKPIGVYEVIVSIHGRLGNDAKSEISKFHLEYEGGNIITIWDKGKGKWQPSDPKPEMGKNTQPPLSSYPCS